MGLLLRPVGASARVQRWPPEREQQSGGGISTCSQSTIRSGERGSEERGAGRRGPARAHSHVNNYRRVSNYKAPLQPADTYSSRVRAARDSFLRAAASGQRPRSALHSLSLPLSHHEHRMIHLNSHQSHAGFRW